MKRGRAALLAGSLIVVSLGAWWFARPTSLNVQDMPDGVTVQEVDGQHVYLRKSGDEVIALLPYAQHFRGEIVYWCPEDEVFLAPTHGEMFDAEGKWLSGPGSRDMDRVDVSVNATGSISIDTGTVERGDPRPLVDLGVLDLPRCEGPLRPPPGRPIGTRLRDLWTRLTA